MLVAAGRRRKPKPVFVYVLALPNGRSRRISNCEDGRKPEPCHTAARLHLLRSALLSATCNCCRDAVNGASVPQRRRDPLSSSADCNFLHVSDLCKAQSSYEPGWPPVTTARQAKTSFAASGKRCICIYCMCTCVHIYTQIHTYIYIYVHIIMYIH